MVSWEWSYYAFSWGFHTGLYLFINSHSFLSLYRILCEAAPASLQVSVGVFATSIYLLTLQFTTLALNGGGILLLHPWHQSHFVSSPCASSQRALGGFCLVVKRKQHNSH